MDSAVKALTPTAVERQKNREIHLAIINEEYSDDYAEYLSDNDDGYTAHEFLDAYVARVRDRRGWQYIGEHRHQIRLRRHWLRLLGEQDAKVMPDEIAGAFAVTFETDDEEDLWLLLTKHYDKRFNDSLRKRMIEGHVSEGVRVAALTCLIKQAPDQIGTVIDNLLTNNDQARLTQLAIELAQLRKNHARPDGKDHRVSTEAALATLPAKFQEISEAAFLLQTDRVPNLSVETHEFLASISAAGADLRGFRIALDHHFALDIEDDVRWLLVHSDDNNVAVDAFEAAIRHEMNTEIAAALHHPFAHVSARALTKVAESMPTPLPKNLLALAEAKGSPVRKALVQLLDKKPHPDHLPTLIALAKDTWTRHSNYNFDVANFPIARAAVAAIEKIGPLDKRVAEELWDIGFESRDPDVRYAIFKLIAAAAVPAFQERLLDLAITPGKLFIRRAASKALLAAEDTLASEIIARITPELIMFRTIAIASDLTLLLALRGDVGVIKEVGMMLATNADRRVFVLLLVWVVKHRDAALTAHLTAMMPADHPSIQLALRGELDASPATILDDLGAPEAVAEVLRYLTLEKE
ncbi:hypothetical protein [Ferrovum sp.]|uniref:hypothetical protein n=1 Tax=Ferrovum sp. TaxID=2609467 RepID=UPI00262DCE6F|nr:hypothetical protein [Ferrovum sp.]